MAPGASDTVSLDNWVASDTDAVYTAQSFTIMSGDEWAGNDTVTRAVVVHGVGVAEASARGVHFERGATVVRGGLLLPQSQVANRQSSSALLDISGREVMELLPGRNDVRALSPGVYFVRDAQARAVRKVVIAR